MYLDNIYMDNLDASVAALKKLPEAGGNYLSNNLLSRVSDGAHFNHFIASLDISCCRLSKLVANFFFYVMYCF